MRTKWLVLGLIWLMMLVAYFDRVNISVAGPSIMAALHLSKTQFGFVLSAFTLGYAVMQVPGGYLADRFGSKPLLVAALLIWSGFTALTGMATSLLSLQLVRVLFGVGEGIENGAQFKLIGDHFSSSERSHANGFFLTALALGPAIATPLTAGLLARFGWRQLFFWFALIGVVAAVLLALFLPSISPQKQEQKKPLDLRPLLTSRSLLLVTASYLLFNMAFWGFLSWIPTYLTSERHVTLSNLGFLGAAPYLCGFVGLIAVGRFGSMPTTTAAGRSVIVGFCYIGAAVFLNNARISEGVSGCIFCLSMAAFFLYGSFGPFWAIGIDMAPPQSRGTLTGFVNFCGQIGGFTAQIVIGFLADRMKSFGDAFFFMMWALLIGALCMMSLQKIIDQPHKLRFNNT